MLDFVIATHNKNKVEEIENILKRIFEGFEKDNGGFSVITAGQLGIGEIEENGNKEKRVTEKGKAAGIEENERKSKYGGIYFAIVHTRLSQQMIIEMLKQYYSDAIIVDAGNEV